MLLLIYADIPYFDPMANTKLMAPAIKSTPSPMMVVGERQTTASGMIAKLWREGGDEVGSKEGSELGRKERGGVKGKQESACMWQPSLVHRSAGAVYVRGKKSAWCSLFAHVQTAVDSTGSSYHTVHYCNLELFIMFVLYTTYMYQLVHMYHMASFSATFDKAVS